MYDTSSMTAGSDYMEMAQLLGDAALPGEAQMVVEKAMQRVVYSARPSLSVIPCPVATHVRH